VPRQPERILDRDFGAGEAVQAPWRPVDPIDRPQPVSVPRNGHVARAEAADGVVEEHAARENTAAVRLELDADDDVVSLDGLIAIDRSVQTQRLREQLGPDQSHAHGEDKTDGRRVESVRAEGPGREVSPEPERERQAAAPSHD
jgi:hypothetical protein